ncbi:hypothetical protein KIPB_002468 [Kipferlia bialata]|uniref:Uncharacterized protein n=1 Tax=Kipferlia bialata TaxID=797122 RepID=A0A9K3CS95_9EUKA|nr:hypothetical protein KIPB_002468 [Kipferlia bialata]|eukprot:g2468.t1
MDVDPEAGGVSREALEREIAELKTAKDKLIQQNLQLLLLMKEKDQKLFRCEMVIRKYRARLVRWFEDMSASNGVVVSVKYS